MIDRQLDIVYASTAGRELRLDLYRPAEGVAVQAAVVLLHGGGWRHGDKKMMEPFGKLLAEKGFLAVAPEYRLLPEAPWPVQLDDVQRAIGWLSENAASFALSEDRIAVQGFSAGGHLALMAGGTSPRMKSDENGQKTSVSAKVAAVVSFFPPIEFTTGAVSADVIDARDLLGDGASAEEASFASPINHVSENFPPTFLLHGTDDDVVPCSTSLRMFEALRTKNVAVELHFYPYHTHEFVRLPSMLQSVQEEIILFLKRTIVDPEKYRRENEELNMFSGKA